MSELSIILALLFTIVVVYIASKGKADHERKRIEEHARDYLENKYKKKFHVSVIGKNNVALQSDFIGGFYWELQGRDDMNVEFTIKQTNSSMLDPLFTDDYENRRIALKKKAYFSSS